jgi:hypothetical protein
LGTSTKRQINKAGILYDIAALPDGRRRTALAAADDCLPAISRAVRCHEEVAAQHRDARQWQVRPAAASW